MTNSKSPKHIKTDNGNVPVECRPPSGVTAGARKPSTQLMVNDMLCTEVQKKLAEDNITADVNAHIAVCEYCVNEHNEMLGISADLALLRRPAAPAGLNFAIIDAVRTENAHARGRILPISTQAREWLTFNLFPYAAGSLASVLICIALLASLNAPPREADPAQARTIFIPGAPAPVDPFALTPEEYAQSRLMFASESPSVNPQGAIVALSKSLVRGEMTDDEVVVVADVFGNGLAKIAMIFERPRDPGTMAAFERAIESGISEAPFVPAEFENRPEIVRVVFRYQQVNVNIGQSERPRG
jgi:hypothetical protein